MWNFAKARLIPIQKSVMRLKFSKGGKKGGKKRWEKEEIYI
jgi:hypothetical protein